MTQEWYYTKDDNQHGPITSKRLKELAASGEFQPTDLVWTEGKDDWKPASIFTQTEQKSIWNWYLREKRGSL